MNECLKAFESCIKSICKKRQWSYNEKDTIKRLIEIVFNEELIPTFMQSHFSGLRSALEAGVPTARNRQSGHGQGTNNKPSSRIHGGIRPSPDCIKHSLVSER